MTRLVSSLLLPIALIACDQAEPLPDPVDPEEPGVEEMGMTWRLHERFPDQSAVSVGCGGEPGRCDPYVGDMPCDTRLPILCFHPLEAPRPAGLEEPSRYHRWSGGAVMLSPAVSPFEDGIETVADADAICASALGPEWRIAHFHDGWGWNFRAFGELPEIEPRDDRFWVHIGDQPDGVCWAL